MDCSARPPHGTSSSPRKRGPGTPQPLWWVRRLLDAQASPLLNHQRLLGPRFRGDDAVGRPGWAHDRSVFTRKGRIKAGADLLTERSAKDHQQYGSSSWTATGRAGTHWHFLKCIRMLQGQWAPAQGRGDARIFGHLHHPHAPASPRRGRRGPWPEVRQVRWRSQHPPLDASSKWRCIVLNAGRLRQALPHGAPLAWVTR